MLEAESLTILAPEAGLHLHRASRLEVLAGRLAERLAAWLPAQPLAPQRVVVAHPGLGRWLTQVLAERRDAVGRAGVVANLQFVLPGEWLQQESAHIGLALGAAELQTDVLRWRLFDALAQEPVAELADYLAAAVDDRRRWELAGHLAAVFAQYLVYRSDWIDAYARADNADWQARLWRRATAAVAGASRGEQLQALSRHFLHPRATAALALGSVEHWFGLNHLPPAMFTLLTARAQHAPVHLYLLDPCSEYWDDLVDERRLLRLRNAGRGEHAEVGHGLLAALARHGQQFNAQLLALPEVDDWRDSHDSDRAPAGSLLQALQQSIRLLDESLLERDVGCADASLRVHACSTRLRELEVLRDAILAELAADPGLLPNQIVVMAPDIAAYADLIPAVFGTPGQPLLAWQISDAPAAAQTALFAAFEQLLRLPQSRLGRSEVLGWLGVPTIARRQGLHSSDVELIERWLEAARVHWGLDAAMQAEHCGVQHGQHSFAWGRERLLLGALVGDDARFEGFAGLSPVAGVEGPEAAVFGRLLGFLQRLAEARQQFGLARPPLRWIDWLETLVSTLFEADADERAEAQALRRINETLETLRDNAIAAEAKAPIDWPAMREALLAALRDPGVGRRFLDGGIQFCGLVPARVVVFEMVGILGLDDGEFPRPTTHSVLNRLHEQPRAGDRDPRAEDRYLFLEALMSARRSLHLSYRGEDAQTGRDRNPAAPLAELLALLARRCRAEPARPWLLKHALQPFDARYTLASEDPRWLGSVAEYLDRQPCVDFLPPPEPPAADAQPPNITFEHLLRFVREPLREYARNGLGVQLDALRAEANSDREQLLAEIDRRDGLELHWLETAMTTGESALPIDPPAQLRASGALPPGLAGQAGWERLRLRVLAGVQALRCAGWAIPLPALPPQRVHDVNVKGALLQAELDGLRLGPDGGVTVFAARFGAVDARHLLPLFLRWALLCVHLRAAPPQAALLVVHGETAAFDAHPPRWCMGSEAQVRQRALQGLERVLGWLQAAQSAPLPLLPASSWAFACAEPRARWRAARSAWAPEHGVGERDYTPSYADYLFRDAEFLDPDNPWQARFVVLAGELGRLLGASHAEGIS